MNKNDLIEEIAARANLTKSDASRALDALTDAISNALKEGDSVSIVGFGTFLVRKRAARAGRNPRTGAEIQIVGANLPAFKPGKALKDNVSGHGTDDPGPSKSR